MPDPIAIHRDGHRCRLKWHRGRRHATDIAFDPDRIRQGLFAGAAVEIDLNPLACGGWAVLHDATLERETTGSGPVSATTAETLAGLWLRANDGRPTDRPVATLAQLCDGLDDAPLPGGGHLQLDIKVGAEALTPENVAGFVRATGPVAGHAILSGGDAAAVNRLADRTGMETGYDPCLDAAMVDLVRNRTFDEFVARASAAMPGARIIYLHRALVAHADAHGADLIAPFRARGQEVDVYTFADTSPQTLDEVRRMLRLRADQVTTDDPAALAGAFAPEAQA